MFECQAFEVFKLSEIKLKSDNKINYEEQGKKMFLISDDISLLRDDFISNKRDI